MEKILKVVGYAGLLAGVIVIAKKIHPNLCREAADTFHDVENNVEHLAEKVEHEVHDRYKAHAEAFTDAETVKALQDARDAFVALLSAKESNDVPENINYVEEPEKDERVFTLGTKEGELAPFSDEYKVIVNSAYEESLKDENFKLRFFGSTYGIGTKGQESEDGSKVFAKDDIAKLKKKL